MRNSGFVNRDRMNMGTRLQYTVWLVWYFNGKNGWFDIFLVWYFKLKFPRMNGNPNCILRYKFHIFLQEIILSAFLFPLEFMEEVQDLNLVSCSLCIQALPSTLYVYLSSTKKEKKPYWRKTNWQIQNKPSSTHLVTMTLQRTKSYKKGTWWIRGKNHMELKEGSK